MDCRPLALGPKVIWTLLSTTVALFHALTGALSTAQIKKVRAAFGMYESTGNIEVKPAYQTSDDCQTWSSAVVIGTPDAQDADGITREGYEDIGAAIEQKKWIRFGLNATNNATTDLQRELANGWLEIDTKPC